MTPATAAPPLATVLVAVDDVATRAGILRTLGGLEDLLVLTAADGGEALATAGDVRPDVLVVPVGGGVDGAALCRRLRQDPALGATMIVLLAAPGDARGALAGLDAGADDVLALPVQAEALLARVRAMLRLKRRHDRLREETLALQERHAELGRGMEQLVGLLGHLVDLARPGARDRADRLAALTAALADRFEVPAHLRADLETAARLLEVGALAGGAHAATAADPAHRFAASSRAVLMDVDRLRDAAELIEAVSEHWDGSGLPGHRQRGQLPLRSRLLRLAADFLAARDEGLGEAQALARVEARAGTWYDPAAVAQLAAIVHGSVVETAPATARRFVPVPDLQPGMTLVDDLRTASGATLLVRGARITEGTLAVIRRRHAHDPVIEGPWVG